MFPYKDPAGGALKPAKALANYRQLLHEQYRLHALNPNSACTLLEAFEEILPGSAPDLPEVSWRAFPITATASNEEIDAQRFRLQDEYVEWSVERTATRVRRITFTTEFMSWWEAVAMAGADALIAAVQALIPGSNPKLNELFGPGFNAQTSSAESRAARFRQFATSNRWNNGSKGILCLTHPSNTMGALFGLVGPAAIPADESIPAGAVCETLGGACVPGRNSDPSIAAAVQELTRAGNSVALADPAGIRIVKLTGIWKRGTQEIDINDTAENVGIWTISRNARRAVLDIPANLTVDGQAITSGAQIANQLIVAASVITAPDTVLPAWARRGQESSPLLRQKAAGAS